MADNTVLNAPTTTGDTIASDDIAGVKHQRVKVEFGADGAASDVHSGNPLPVSVITSAGSAIADDSAFTPGTTPVTPSAGTYRTARDPLDNNDAGAIALTQNRGQFVTLEDSAAVERGTTTNPLIVRLGDGTDLANIDANGDLHVSVRDVNPSIVTDTLDSLNDVTVAVNLGFSAVSFQITGTWSGTISFEASNNGSDFVALEVLRVGDGVPVTTTTTNGIFVANIGGLERARVRMSSYSSGTASIWEEKFIGPAKVIAAARITNAATDPGNVQISDGTRTATVRDTGASDSLNVAIVDAAGAQITSFGGGTQYAEDTAHVTGDQVTMAGVVQQSADAALSTDGDRSLLQVDASGFLKVNIKAGAGAGGTSMTDDAAFTPGATAITPVGGTYRTARDPLDDNDAGAIALTQNRGQFVTIEDAASANSVQVTANGDLAVDMQGITTTNVVDTLTALNDATTFGLDGFSAVAVQVSGTWSATVSFQASVDGANWTALQMVTPDSPIPVTSTTANGTFAAEMGGFEKFRVIATSYSSGTVDVRLHRAISGGKHMVHPGVDIGDVTINNAAGGAAVNIQDGGNSITIDGSVSVTGAVDTELPTAAALGDAQSATPTTPTVGSVGMLMNATTVDRQRAVVAALDSTGTGIAAAGIVGQFDDTATAAVTENQFAPVRISTRRALLVEGVASGTNVNVAQATAANLNAEVQGDAAHDAVASGNPVLAGGSSETMADSAPANRVSADADASRLSVTDGALFVIPTGPQTWSYHENSSAALTDTSVHALPGAGLSLYVTDIKFSTGAATAFNIFFEEGAATVLGPWYLEAVAGRGAAITFQTPKKITANTALTVTTSAAIAHSIDVTGFIAPG